jgi:hypothetical protein
MKILVVEDEIGLRKDAADDRVDGSGGAVRYHREADPREAVYS